MYAIEPIFGAIVHSPWAAPVTLIRNETKYISEYIIEEPETLNAACQCTFPYLCGFRFGDDPRRLPQPRKLEADS